MAIGHGNRRRKPHGSEPCAFIEGIRDGLRSEIEGKRGMLAYVTSGGSLKVGDAVKPI